MSEENVLLVDNELLTRDLLGNHLKHMGFKVLAVENSIAARKLIPGSRFRLALIGDKVGDKSLRELIACLGEHEIDSLVFQVTSQVRDSAYLEQRQLYDAIIKPFRLEEVGLKLRHAVETIALRRALRSSADKIKRLEKELAACGEAAEEVAIPGLSELEADSQEQEYGQETGAKESAGEAQEPEDDLFEKIRKLDVLRKAGILTSGEFSRKKKELLDRI